MLCVVRRGDNGVESRPSLRRQRDIDEYAPELMGGQIATIAHFALRRPDRIVAAPVVKAAPREDPRQAGQMVTIEPEQRSAAAPL